MTSRWTPLNRVFAVVVAANVSLVFLTLPQLDFVMGNAAKRPYPQVTKLELHERSNGGSVLLLQVRNYRKGNGGFVHAYVEPRRRTIVTARRVRGSYHHWRIGPRVEESRTLLARITRRLLSDRAVTVTASVPSRGPLPGISHDFRIKDFDEPAHPMRAR